MNCKPGDLAYLVRANLSENIGVVVEVICLDLTRAPTESAEQILWICKCASPVRSVDRVTHKIMPGWIWDLSIPDANLRPISGVPLDDETPIETNVPEALQLALGIESRSYA